MTTMEGKTMLAIRTTPEVKAKLRELAELMGKDYGTRMTQTQALEMAIQEALTARKD